MGRKDAKRSHSQSAMTRAEPKLAKKGSTRTGCVRSIVYGSVARRAVYAWSNSAQSAISAPESLMTRLWLWARVPPHAFQQLSYRCQCGYICRRGGLRACLCRASDHSGSLHTWHRLLNYSADAVMGGRFACSISSISESRAPTCQSVESVTQLGPIGS